MKRNSKDESHQPIIKHLKLSCLIFVKGLVKMSAQLRLESPFLM
jgi:hypothetical protein